MDPELADAEYTTNDSKEAESVWEILDDIVVVEYFKPWGSPAKFRRPDNQEDTSSLGRRDYL
ncbi:MAG: hypothetical protein V3U79_06245 [Dehalococcoidia bacterium]